MSLFYLARHALTSGMNNMLLSTFNTNSFGCFNDHQNLSYACDLFLEASINTSDFLSELGELLPPVLQEYCLEYTQVIAQAVWIMRFYETNRNFNPEDPLDVDIMLKDIAWKLRQAIDIGL